MRGRGVCTHVKRQHTGLINLVPISYHLYSRSLACEHLTMASEATHQPADAPRSRVSFHARFSHDFSATTPNGELARCLIDC